MNVLGISGFQNAVPFKKSRWPTLNEREYRISQGHDSAAALVVNGRDINAFAAANNTPPMYPGKLTLFRSSTREMAEDNDQFLGWGGLARELEVRHIPSSHFDILQEPSVRFLAGELNETLAQLAATDSGAPAFSTT